MFPIEIILRQIEAAPSKGTTKLVAIDGRREAEIFSQVCV